MIVEIVGKELKPVGPVLPVTIRILDHTRAPYSEDLVQVEVLDYEDQVLQVWSVKRMELCRAARAFEIRRGG